MPKTQIFYFDKPCSHTVTEESILQILKTLFPSNNLTEQDIEFTTTNKIQIERESQYIYVTFFMDKNEYNDSLIIVDNFNIDNYKYKELEHVECGIVMYPTPQKMILYGNEPTYSWYRPIKGSYIQNQTPLEEHEKLCFLHVKIKGMLEPAVTPNFRELQISTEKAVEFFYNDSEFYPTEDIYLNITGPIEKMSNEQKNIIFLQSLEKMYGKDILTFFDISGKYPLTAENRFFRKKLFKGIIPKLICCWIIDEYENLIKINANMIVNNLLFKNFPTYLEVKDMIHVNNFMDYTAKLIIEKIKIDYKIEKAVLNITNLFITKNEYIKDNPDVVKNNQDMNEDGTFLTINIALNDSFECMDQNKEIGHKIWFEHDENVPISLDAGDLIVYNGKIKRNRGDILKGGKYMLVATLELAL